MKISLKEIFQSSLNKMNPTEDQKVLAEARRNVCTSCEFAEREGSILARCKKCGCFLELKTFSPVEGACPIGKWDKVETEILLKQTKASLKKEKTSII